MRLLPFLLLLGCTIINDPPDPYDAGPRDVGSDADDATVDAPPDVPDGGGGEICFVTDEVDEDDDGEINCADVEDCEGMSCSPIEGSCICRNGRAVELACTGGDDDDADGTIDCADFDCAGLRLEECCAGAGTPGHWPTAVCPTTGWTEGEGDANCDGTNLIELMGSEPFGLVWGDCLSLALGATFEFDVRPNPAMDTTCDVDGRCTENLKLLVAERNMPREGNGLFFAELAVVAHASGRIEVLQGDAPAPDSSFTVSGLTRIKIRFRPATAADGDAELRATVTYDQLDEDETELWEGFVVSLDELIEDGECVNVPGFYLAFEGLGDAVSVERFVATQSECSNPNLFQPSTDGVLTPYDYAEDGTTSLELDPPRLIDAPRETEASWATQALSSPTLMSVGGDWMVAAEASNDQPANEPSFRVGYAIAYRENSTWNDELTGWTDGGSDRPWVGNQPPSCLDGSCSGEFSPEMPPYPSVRDPFLFRVGSRNVLAFVGEVDADGEPARTERYGIYVENQSALGDGSVPDEATLIPSEVSGCDSLRDPMVAPRPGTGSDSDWWLFFTCYEGLGSQGIWAVPMTSAGGYEVIGDGEDIVTPEVVLEPSSLDFGRGGTLRSPEIVLDRFGEGEAETAVFAMWFLVGQEVGVAIGAGKSDFVSVEMTNDVPVFQLFEGNPVLVRSDRAFSRGCSGCSIEGLAVTRTDDDTLRFLVARENDDTPARYDLLPLDQTWRNLARP